MSNFRRPAVVSPFILLALLLLVLCHGHKTLQRKRCPVNKYVKFTSVIQVYVNTSQEFQWQVDAVNNRSLSPWIYSDDKNDSRFPSTIKEAKCLGRCVDSKGNMNSNLYSVPIEQEILVLQREMQGCKATFQLKTAVVSVGCTCVRHP